MSKKTCHNCLFNDQCPVTRPCGHYTPVVEDDDDDEVVIENGRKQFRREWGAYLADADASDF